MLILFQPTHQPRCSPLQWQIYFRIEDGNVFDTEIVGYH
jgi:hypothetical protein